MKNLGVVPIRSDLLVDRLRCLNHQLHGAIIRRNSDTVLGELISNHVVSMPQLLKARNRIGSYHRGWWSNSGLNCRLVERLNELTGERLDFVRTAYQ